METPFVPIVKPVILVGSSAGIVVMFKPVIVNNASVVSVPLAQVMPPLATVCQMYGSIISPSFLVLSDSKSVTSML